MNREIKFRGQKVGNKEWVYGSLIIRPDKTCAIVSMSVYDFWEIIPNTVGQFTGKFDNNGTEIYEGDIVKDKFDEVAIVRWSASFATFNIGCIEYEIINNIY